VSTHAPTDQPNHQARDAARIGRHLGVVLFWVLCCFVIGMSSRSIIPALYFPASAPLPDAKTVRACATELAALQHELSQAAAACVRSGRVEGWNAQLDAWDARFLALDGGCGPLEPARGDLRALRTQLGALVQDFGNGALKAQKRLQRALSALSGANAGSS